MKNILITTYDDIKNPVYGGGGARAVHVLAKHLSGKNNVEVISWNHSGRKKEVIDGVRYTRFGWNLLHPKLGMFVFQIVLPFKVLFKKTDLVIESFGPPFTTSFLPVFIGKEKVVGIVHMLSSEDMQRKYHLPVFGVLEKLGLRRYENLITTTSQMKTKVTKISPVSKIKVISNGVEKVGAIKTKKKDQILFLGRIEIDQKGLDILIHAFSKTKDSKMTLVVAGNGMKDEFSKLNKLVNESPYRSRIVLRKAVKGKEKSRLLSESLLLVVPSRFETYSMVALEGMSYGLPVICFDIEGLRWVPSTASVKVKPFSTDDLAKHIDKVSKSKSELYKMSKAGSTYARNFTWEKVLREYTNYLKSLNI